ncbi:MAG: two-component sensor histidine kinase [Ruminococcaceae bacterium]|nr:two-component sensor histidine kinase [Oscillospiraceae bacterium]
MTSKIFRSIFATSLIVLLATLAIITTFLYSYFTNIQIDQLKDELSIASVGTEKSGKEYLEGLRSDNFRLTWVANDGTVLFDSQADKATMDNHLDREEIKEAFETGKGSSSRRSATLTEKTLYEAVLLSDGTVLRISVNRASGFVLLLGMAYPVVIVIIIAVVVSAVLAHKMSKRIIEPLNKLDLDNPTENDAYEEIAPLLSRIHKQNMKIERKAAELNRRKEEFELITKNMREGLILLDKNRSILTINSAAMTIFGTDENCVGNEFLTINRRHEITSAIEKALTDGHAEIRASLNEKEYQFDISRIETNGETVGAVILAFDITEQADAERLRREFTANVSHELKTPLQTITGSAELIENGLVKQEDMPRFVGHIREEATRLVMLVEDIIRLSQLDEQTELPKETVSLYDIANEACKVLSDSADKKGITLSVSGDGGSVCGVKHLLFEVIYNLCDNSIKYTPDGGKVKVDISETGKEVTLTVSDNGIGIAPEHLPRIFERFYRVDKSHSKKSGADTTSARLHQKGGTDAVRHSATGGTGLGLSIVKHSVQYHGGKISIQSEENKGTVITVVLPKK